MAGPLPLAGFFAQGELGPVSGRNHLHGFTASLALFESPTEGAGRAR
jgi:small ligand-binding sensory domain FIST